MRATPLLALTLAGLSLSALLATGVAASFAPRMGMAGSGAEEMSGARGYEDLNLTYATYALFVPRSVEGTHQLRAEWGPPADVVVVAPTYEDIRAALVGEEPPHVLAEATQVRAFEGSVAPYRPPNGVPPADIQAQTASRMLAQQLSDAPAENRLPREARIQQYDQALLAAYGYVIVWRLDAPIPDPMRAPDFQPTYETRVGGMPDGLAPTLLGAAAVLGLAAAGAGVAAWQQRGAGAEALPQSVLERALRSAVQFEAFARRSKNASRAILAALGVAGFAAFFALTLFSPKNLWPSRDAAYTTFLALFVFGVLAALVLGAAWVQRAKRFERDMRDWRIRFEEVRRDQDRFLEAE